MLSLPTSSLCNNKRLSCGVYLITSVFILQKRPTVYLYTFLQVVVIGNSLRVTLVLFHNDVWIILLILLFIIVVLSDHSSFSLS